MFFADQPYAYAGNNPLINVDPTGQRYSDALIGPESAAQQIAQTRRTQQVMRQMPPRVTPRHPAPLAVHPATHSQPAIRRVISSGGPNSCRSDASCGCYTRCGAYRPPSCGQNAICDVGSPESGGLMALEGYMTNTVAGLGDSARQALIGLLSSLLNDINGDLAIELAAVGVASGGSLLFGGLGILATIAYFKSVRDNITAIRARLWNLHVNPNQVVSLHEAQASGLDYPPASALKLINGDWGVLSIGVQTPDV